MIMPNFSFLGHSLWCYVSTATGLYKTLGRPRPPKVTPLSTHAPLHPWRRDSELFTHKVLLVLVDRVPRAFGGRSQGCSGDETLDVCFGDTTSEVRINP